MKDNRTKSNSNRARFKFRNRATHSFDAVLDKAAVIFKKNQNFDLEKTFHLSASNNSTVNGPLKHIQNPVSHSFFRFYQTATDLSHVSRAEPLSCSQRLTGGNSPLLPWAMGHFQGLSPISPQCTSDEDKASNACSRITSLQGPLADSLLDGEKVNDLSSYAH
ncbi:hypothetical protein TNIN_7291 [Trichonephila inaurata madagascariensis]|uniref:Uncharacterized protein n=1 Tax=Trichonephila inaurata madagascariensis TaxID=2747483 RepID=A0A8X7CEG6_9ARAC|nr:hypothetical protein TNIN_7291 [Trichonephila inaurata madagascariensis]